MAYYGRRYSKFDLILSCICLLVVALYKFMMVHPKWFFFILIVIVPLGVVICMKLLDHDCEKSIKEVPRVYITGVNTLANSHCTVKFFPKDKLIAMDNRPDRNNHKQMFTLKRGGKININKAWSNICRVFNEGTNIVALALLLDIDQKDIVVLESRTNTSTVPEKKQINITSSNLGPKFVDIEKITPDPYVKGTEFPNEGGKDFVNIDGLNEVKPTVERFQPEPEFVDMNSVVDKVSVTVDINFAQAAELALLPGINIVKAKKIIDYRNKNGLFNSIDEFIAAAEVKSHFVSKIKQMAVLNTSKPNDGDNDDNYEGRIIDF